MRTRQKRRKRRIAPAGLLLISVFALGGVWFADAVRRAVDPPSGNVEWTTEPTDITLETQPPETQPATRAPFIPETTEEVLIQDAATELFEKPQDPVPEGYAMTQIDATFVHNGPLILLDESHPFSGTTGDLVTFHNKNASYRMKRLDFSTRPEVFNAMNEMGDAYFADNGMAGLMIYSTMAPYDAPGSFYQDALPDRSSGYGLDFCTINPDDTLNKLRTANPWLLSNSWKYGFIFSYTEADADVTGVSAAPYHLRYVGKLHASIMHENGLTLSQYLETLREYTVDAPMQYTLGDTTYSIYYEPSVSSQTSVPLPTNQDYEISGNNVDGFIISVAGSITA